MRMKQKNKQQDLQDKAEVLIALAAQETKTTGQPPSPEELVDFFENSQRFSEQRQDEILAYLDSTPEAYERWIKQGKQAVQPQRARSIFSIIPYATATCAALLIIGFFLFWQRQEFKLDQAVDRAYKIAVSINDPDSFQRARMSLADSLDSSGELLSFSQAGQPSQMAQAFMLGLQYDWQQTSDSSDSANDRQNDYQMGRWYTVLWTVSQQNTAMPTDFWQEQLDIVNHLQAHYDKRAQETNTTATRAIALQLKRIHSIIEQLAENNQITKPYQQLEQTLTALRYSVIHSL